MSGKYDWLQSLTVGDKVIVYHCYNRRDSQRVKTVTRITATLICIGESRYRKSDGRLIGEDSWSISRLEEWSQEAEDAINQTLRDLKESQVLKKWFELNQHSPKALALAYRALVAAGRILNNET
jgi:hypothetical protein